MPTAVKTKKQAETADPWEPGPDGKIMLPRGYGQHPYDAPLLKGSSAKQHRLMLGIPTTGITRAEFWLALRSLGVPTNWSCADRIYFLNESMPIGYSVADGRNIIVDAAVKHGFEWLLFIDHDVLVPRHLYVTLNEYMLKGDIPIVSGLYCTKATPTEPLVYRGRGNGYYRDWKLGDKIWVDGTGCGCLLINTKILKLMWQDAPEYLADGRHLVRKVFETPSFSWIDTNIGEYRGLSGTEDLSWYTRIYEGGYLSKAGFTKVAKKKWPILVETSLFCGHIDLESGIVYPIKAEW